MLERTGAVQLKTARNSQFLEKTLAKAHLHKSIIGQPGAQELAHQAKAVGHDVGHRRAELRYGVATVGPLAAGKVLGIDGGRQRSIERLRAQYRAPDLQLRKFGAAVAAEPEIGRAACRERVCQYV